jgi:hypothetical protein
METNEGTTAVTPGFATPVRPEDIYLRLLAPSDSAAVNPGVLIFLTLVSYCFVASCERR